MNILNLIDQALTPPAERKASPPMPGNRYSLNPPTPQTPAPRKVELEQAYQLATEGIDVVSGDELVALRSLQARWQQHFAGESKTFNDTAAQQEFSKLDREQWERFYQSGENVSTLDVITFDKIKTRFDELRKFSTRARAEVEAEALRFCAPIRRRFIATATKELNRIEKKDREEAEAYGLPYAPHPRAIILKQLIFRLDHNDRNPSPASPLNLLPFLDL